METKTQSFRKGKASQTRTGFTGGFEKAKAFALALLVTAFLVATLAFVATTGTLALVLVGAGAMAATTALPFVFVKAVASVI